MGKLKMGILMAGLVAVLAVAGCGSSGDTTEGSSSIPKPEYVKRASAICLKSERKKYNQIGRAFKLARASGKSLQDFTEKDLENVTETTVVPVLQDMLAELKQLPESKKGQAQFEQLITKREGELKQVKAEPALFVKGEAFNASNAMAASIGLRKCILNQG